MTVVLDSTPVGLLCHPKNPPIALQCRTWVDTLLANGRKVVLPEIIDYEMRRELKLNNQSRSLQMLDALRMKLVFAKINSAIMLEAADMWAQVRRIGLPTASTTALDCDVILAAQALDLGEPVIVATDNIAHLSRFVPAERWELIAP